MTDLKYILKIILFTLAFIFLFTIAVRIIWELLDIVSKEIIIAFLVIVEIIFYYKIFSGKE